MPSPRQFTSKQKAHWNGVADGWAAWLDWTERNFAPVTEWLRQTAGWKPAAGILDVACGAGYPALTAARCVGPAGRVVAIDISPGMIAAAARLATAAGLENLEFHEMDAEDLQFEDASFAAVTNAYGLMFCRDPQRAIGHAHRVLAPGGRCTLIVWDEASRNPFLTLFSGVAARFLSLPAAEPSDPGPFRLAPAGALESLVRASGFSDVRVDSIQMTVRLESVAQYCRLFADVAWKSRMASLTDSQAALFHQAIVEAARPFMDGGGLRLMATSLCASGSKQEPVSG